MENNEQYTYEQLKEMFKDYSKRVTFEKKDGSTRVMDVTLNQELLEELIQKDETEEKIEEEPKQSRGDPEGIITVYSIDANNWRRINIDKIISIEDIENG